MKLPTISLSNKSKSKTTKLFKGIKAVIFDVDGVMTDGGLYVFPDGEQVRRFNVKDGWGIRSLIEKGFYVAVISAGSGEGLRKRLSYLGIEDIYLATRNKLNTFEKYCKEKGITTNEVAYMGDDFPDLQVIKRVGIACCPADAIHLIRNECRFVSQYDGGQGAVRDLCNRVIIDNE